MSSTVKIGGGKTVRFVPINYQVKMIFLHRDTPCTNIYVDFKNSRVSIDNFIDDLTNRAFGVIEEPTWEDFEFFLKDRCFPETRGHIRWFLDELGVDSYDPMRIVEKTRGRCAEDNMRLDIRYGKGGLSGNRFKRRPSRP